MAEEDEVLKAISALNGKDFKGRNLKINEAQPRPTSPEPAGSAAAAGAAEAAATGSAGEAHSPLRLMGEIW